MTDKPTPTDAVALARYKVVPAHESMFHRFAVVAGDGKQQLYLGREVECENMARKFVGAFLDGAFYQANITPSTQAAESVPAVEREQERIAFKDAHRHLDLDEMPDAWGRPMFKHSHVEASWLGWIARASREQASSQAGEYPALVRDYCGALTPDPWHSSGMLHGKMSKHIHSCDACAAQGAAQAAPVDAAVQQDAERLDFMIESCTQVATISPSGRKYLCYPDGRMQAGSYPTARAAIDAAAQQRRKAQMTDTNTLAPSYAEIDAIADQHKASGHGTVWPHAHGIAAQEGDAA